MVQRMPLRYDLYVRETDGKDRWVGSVLAHSHAEAMEQARYVIPAPHAGKPIVMRPAAMNDDWHSASMAGPPPN